MTVWQRVWDTAALWMFVMDLCSQRTVEGREARVYGEEQLAALSAFLFEQRDRPALFVVLTVPPVYLPDWVVALERPGSSSASS